MILNNLLENMKLYAGVAPIFMTFSAQSKALATQLTMEGKLDKKRKNLLGAPSGKKVTIMIDDVNMPAVEEYGAQPPIEVVRLLIDKGGFYDRKKLFWKDVENTTIHLCAGPPGGGRNEMTPRLTRHFHVVCMPATSESAMRTIFDSILVGFLGKFKPEVQHIASQVVGSTLDVYTLCGEELLPTPTLKHRRNTS